MGGQSEETAHQRATDLGFTNKEAPAGGTAETSSKTQSETDSRTYDADDLSRE